jgi:hypothetical protein
VVIRRLSWLETLYQYIALFCGDVTMEWRCTRGILLVRGFSCSVFGAFFSPLTCFLFFILAFLNQLRETLLYILLLFDLRVLCPLFFILLGFRIFKKISNNLWAILINACKIFNVFPGSLRPKFYNFASHKSLLYLYLYEYVEDNNTGFNSTGEREHLLMVSESRFEALNGGNANYIFLQMVLIRSLLLVLDFLPRWCRCVQGQILLRLVFHGRFCRLYSEIFR